MSSLYQLYCGFALAYAAVSENEYTLAVHLYKNTMAAYARCEMDIE